MRDSVTNTFPAVALAGCGAVTAVGHGVSALREAMRTNASGLRPDSRFDNPRYQTCIVGAAPTSGETEAEGDPAYRLALDALKEALAEAEPTLGSIPAERRALVLATTKANIEALERRMANRACPESALRHLQGDLLAADLAECCGALGPVACVSNACVSGLVALQHGARLIQRGAADAALVVGVDHLSAFILSGFTALKAMAPTGCQPFDRDRRGLSAGEAGAAIVLVRASALKNRDHILLRGWGTSNDANHMTGPSRDGAGLARAIRLALEAANLLPGAINYINAHGTGTNYNDAMESQAIREVFGEAGPPVSGSKGMLGHTLGAAGVVETILCVLAMRQKLLPGTPGLRTPDAVAPVSLIAEPRPAGRLDHVLKLNTGFGGVNGAIILARE